MGFALLQVFTLALEAAAAAKDAPRTRAVFISSILQRQWLQGHARDCFDQAAGTLLYGQVQGVSRAQTV